LSLVHFTDTCFFGGAERMLLTLVGELVQRRRRCILLYYLGPGTEQLSEHAKSLGIETLGISPPCRRRDLTHFARLVQLLGRCRPSVFHAHLTWPLRCSYGIVAAALTLCPAVIATQHLLSANGVGGRRLKQRLVGSCVDRYVAVSEDMARTLRAALDSERKVRVIHNGVALDPPAMASASLRAALSPTPDRPLVLTVARLHPQKGLAYLLSAATCVPNAVFLVAGDGPQRGALEAESRRLGLGERVIFLGHRGDVPALLACCDLFVLPSLFEGLPVSVLEAMAAGKPVIATAIGGTDEAVVHGETGLLVQPGDPVALAEAINVLLADISLADRFGTAGRARVEREFSAEVMVDRVTLLYDEVLATREE
jgi:glycosyltransferase involved in cell wall biosynthesis